MAGFCIEFTPGTTSIGGEILEHKAKTKTSLRTFLSLCGEIVWETISRVM